MALAPSTAPGLTAATQGTGGIQVDDVSMVYRTGRGQTHALDSCRLSVEEGSRAAIIGPSGCGKSTLLRVVADLIAGATGHASLGGLSPREARLSQQVAMVGQASGMLTWRRLVGNVALGLEMTGMAKRERLARVQHAIELVGLAGFERCYPHELSGGMRQRAAIARALAMRPRFLLMDEPFGALDEITRLRLNFELLRILEEEGTTLLLVTHSITEAVLLSDRVFVMSARPGHITHSIDIGFGHHRTAELREDHRFLAHEAFLRDALHPNDHSCAPPTRKQTDI
jgi:NitT/TauT family transport system ATP-binding protein